MGTDARNSISTYYERLGRWTAVARLVGYGGGRHARTIHRALSDPVAAGRPSSTRLHDVLVEALGRPLPDSMVSARVPRRGLDAGCGFGGTMVHLHRQLGGTFVGLTLSESQAASGRRTVERLGLGDAITFSVQSYDAPPPGPFDLVIAIESLAHSPCPAVSVAALARVLATRGRLVIVDDMPEGQMRESGEAMTDLATFKAGWQCPVLWSAEEYRQALSGLGLRTEREIDLTTSCRPRSLTRIGQLEWLNRAARKVVPSAPWHSVMDSYHGGLALERLIRRGTVRYRLFVARKL